MWNKISQIILRNRITIIIILLGLTAMFAFNVFGKLKLDNKFGAMLPKDSPEQAKYLEF